MFSNDVFGNGVFGKSVFGSGVRGRLGLLRPGMSLSCFARGLRLAASLSRHSLAHRSFSTSRSLAFARPTPPLLYSPRWVNPKNNKEDDSEQNEEDEHENNQTDELKDSPSSSSVAPTEPPSDSQPPPAPLPPSSSSPPPGSIARNSVPEVYPQVLALPIARRPLFPGFYKAVVVRNPAVVAAIKEMMKRGQPYLGAFLLEDENTDADVITDINQVHQVGVFAQITSVFMAPSSREPDGAPGEKQEEGLTGVLYPHRKIRITELVQPGGPSSMSGVQIEPESTTSDGNPRCQHHPPHLPRKVKTWNNPLQVCLTKIITHVIILLTLTQVPFRRPSCSITPPPSSASRI